MFHLRYLRMMDQPNNGFSMSRWYASYVTLDMQIIYLFAIRLVRSIVRMFDGRGTVFSWVKIIQRQTATHEIFFL